MQRFREWEQRFKEPCESHFPADATVRLDRKTNFEFADQDLFIGLPYSDFARWIYDNEIYSEALSSLPLLRLQYIKSLSLLSGISSDQQPYIASFNHARLSHTLIVATISEMILKQANVGQAEIKKGVVGALLHDIATPALGNPVMDVDPSNLSEENWWREAIRYRGGRNFFARHLLDENEIDKIIHNKGYLGEVLDIADRITYVSEDASAIVGPLALHDQSGRIDPQFADLDNIARQDPKFGNIYQEVGLDQDSDKVFFNNPERLYRFLKLRALLIHKVYLHPLNQARDRLVTELIRPFYTDGKLTPNILRHMTDHDLINFINESYLGDDVGSYSNFSYWDVGFWPAKYEKFQTVESAVEFEQECENMKDRTVLGGVKMVKGFNPATSYLVKDGKSQIRPYCLIDPQGAEEIEEIEKNSRGVYVLYVDLDNGLNINRILRRKKEMFGN